jgi:peptide/nickel transport system permease protein
MVSYAARRLLLMVPTLVLITGVVFAVVKLAPGNPFSAALSTGEGAVKQMNPQDYQSLLSRYGLDRPWYVQYGRWLRSAATGSFGDSFLERRPVVQVLFSSEGPGWSRFGATLFLNALALLLMLGLGLPTGLWAAVRAGTLFDRASSLILYGLYCIPSFWLAVLLIMGVGVKLHWLPFLGMHGDGYEALSAAGRLGDVLRHALLPAFCLAAGGAAFMARFTRGALLDVLSMEHVRAARAKGLSEGAVLLRHGLRNSLVPLMTLLGLLLPALISGSVIVEQVFGWPGLGQLTIQAIYGRDYPVIMAVALMGAAAVLLSNLLTDLSYRLADPRVQVE